MELKSLMAKIANVFVKGAASTIVINKSADADMNKGRGTNRNPFIGRVRIIETLSGFVMGTDYRKSIEAAAERNGNEGAEAVLKKNWHKPCSEFGEWFSTDIRTESKVYLKLQRNEKQVACKIEKVYLLDGKPATTEELNLIKSWLKAKSTGQSTTQTDLGLTKENEQHYLLTNLENVVSIKQKDRVLNIEHTTFDVTTIEIKGEETKVQVFA